MAPDRAVYEAYSTWQALKVEGYNCYAVRTGSDSDFSVKFMDALNGGSELDFSKSPTTSCTRRDRLHHHRRHGQG